VKTNKTRRASKTSAKSLAARSMGKYVLRLFVAGATARSRQAILRVRQLCEARPKDDCTLEVIDIYQQPRLARDNQIKESPRPERRFIGNLLNTAGLFVELDLVRKVKVAL
jgi:circadian clock protein KaiB